MKIYYSSNVIVNKPKIITDGFYKDYEEIKKRLWTYCSTILSKL